MNELKIYFAKETSENQRRRVVESLGRIDSIFSDSSERCNLGSDANLNKQPEITVVSNIDLEQEQDTDKSILSNSSKSGDCGVDVNLNK